MVDEGVIDLTVDWYPDVQNDILTFVHFHLDPSKAKTEMAAELQKVLAPHWVIHFNYSNIIAMTFDLLSD